MEDNTVNAVPRRERLIFLDIDGVLNYDEWFETPRVENRFVDPLKVEYLNRLNDGNTFVVITSTWGENGAKMLEYAGLKIPIIGYTERIHLNLDRDYLCRGNDIAHYIYTNYGRYETYHGYASVDYVIIDDNDDMLNCQMSRLVHVDSATGLSERDVADAAAILNREED